MQSDYRWQEATLVAIRELCPTIHELTLDAGLAAPPFEAGSHVGVQVMIGERSDRRSYSLVGLPRPDGHYRIAVKLAPEGRGGSAYLWQLEPGQRLSITTPRSTFPLEVACADVLLVAGGIGITPLVGMAQRLAAAGRRVRLHYGAATSSDLVYRDELRAALGDDLHLYARAEGRRIDLAGVIGELSAHGDLYFCGPVPMLEAVRAAWHQAARKPERLRFETFGNSGHLVPRAFTVRLPNLGKTINVHAQQTLLEAMEASGIEALYDCRRGECGLCRLKVLACDGEIDHRDVFLSERQHRQSDTLCVCVSRATGTLTLDCGYRPDTDCRDLL